MPTDIRRLVSAGPILIGLGCVGAAPAQAQRLQIQNLNPTLGGVGAAVSVWGSNFGSTQGSITVTFNGTAAAVTPLLVAGAWAVTYYRGIAFAFGRNPGLSLGVKFGAILGTVWLVCFGFAWWIVYGELKSKLANLNQFL